MAATRLYSTSSVEEQWLDVAGPWLRAQAGAAWRNPRPTVVLTPSRAESFYLRGRLVEEGVPCLGLRFWTPSDTRKFLLAERCPGAESATQAELRFIARACAEKLAARADSDNATLASVMREPGAFLRAYDLLLGAGWDPASDGADYGLNLAYVMQVALEKCGIATQAGLHRHLRQATAFGKDKEPLIANLLIAGFNATHWPLWDLLQAAVFSADEATIALLEPRVFAEEIDQLWNSSWEEFTQSEGLYSPGPVGSSEISSPFSALVASYEQGAPGDSSDADITFLVTADLATHIRAIVLQTLGYLKYESCARLGIVFAEANALALGVGQELRRLGLPLDDGTGAFRPGCFERRCWQTWLALQEEPGVPQLIAWLRACEAEGRAGGIPETLSARDVANVLDGALGEALIDDLEFLALHLERASGERASRVAEFLRRRIVLPEEASFSQFLTLTRQAVALPGWEDFLAGLQIDPPAWLRDSDEVFSRLTYLGWLRESTASQTRERGAEGNHFYGKIHLTIYAQMTGQTWSHLILTGLNEGVWPRVYDAGAFGSRHELAALNQQARALNLRSTAQGGQGMGHEIVRGGHGHCLLPLERQDLALRDLGAALEGTRKAVCLTAMTTEGGRSLLPNDFFNHAYHAKTGGVLDEESFRSLAHATDRWRRRNEASLPASTATPTDPMFDDLPLFAQPIQFATRAAYVARRDPVAPFGRYEFAHAQPPRQPIQLPCKRWDDAWHHPATVWLEEIVGAAPWPEGTLSWQRAVGTWVHRWLAAALREWRREGDAPELAGLIRIAADREAQAVQRRAREIDFELYPWWDQVWNQARSVALGLGETLALVLPDRPFLSEYRIPRDLMIALPGSDQPDFALKGRIDLLLIEPGVAAPDLAQGDLAGCSCWIVDFKTGAADKLTASKIGEGNGLQAVLYALAAQARGAASVAISMHTPDAPLKHQVRLDAVREIAPLFRSLDILHRRGVFGQRPDGDSAYGYSPAYPMATRLIPADILKAKWALVHGAEPATETEAE